jgi:hypothetical protein
MIKDIKKTKKKINLNGKVTKVGYEVFLLIREQSNQLMNHEAALTKYAQIYEAKKKHTEDEQILYDYCMQLESVTNILKHIKENKDEKENNSKS